MGLVDRVEKTVEVYNRYRSPEAHAKILRVDEKYVEVEFSGPYCRTCGYYDYFEDFVIEAEDQGIKLEIDEIKDMVDYAVVRFRVKK